MTRAREAARLIGNNTFRLDSNNAVGFNSTTPDAMFDINHGLTVAGVSTFSGNVTMSGDLTVNGTTTTLDTIVQEVDLINIQANSSTPGLGVTQSGSGDIAKFYDGTSAVFTIADGGGVTVESGVLTLNNNLDMQDSDKILLGTGDDLEIYHNGTDTYIDNNTGNVYVRNLSNDKNIVLQTDDGSGGTTNFVECNGIVGEVRLYYYGSEKLNTKSDGVEITGELECDSLDVDGAADITGNVTLHANLDLQDNDKILVGTGDDLEIYHDGSDSFITHVGTGFVYLQNTTNDADVIIRSDDGSGGLASYVVCDGSTGETKLYYYGSNKLNTKTDGINVTGDVQCDSIDVDGDVNFEGANYDAQWDRSQNRLRLNDDAKLTLGSDNDFEIYHNGTNAVIDNNTGDLNITTTGSGDDIYLDAADDIYLRVAGTESGVSIIGDGAVELYHNNSKKFETTSSGVTVTGDVNSTSDINLKKDIEVVDSSTEMLNQLRGVKFTWKENDEKSVGVIAQEVEAILPELVKGEEGDKSVNYSGLVGVLIEAVKELSARVEELENK